MLLVVIIQQNSPLNIEPKSSHSMRRFPHLTRYLEPPHKTLLAPHLVILDV